MTAEKGPFAFISEVTALGLDVFRHYPTKFRKRVNKPLHRPISTKKNEAGPPSFAPCYKLCLT